MVLKMNLKHHKKACNVIYVLLTGVLLNGHNFRNLEVRIIAHDTLFINDQQCKNKQSGDLLLFIECSHLGFLLKLA